MTLGCHTGKWPSVCRNQIRLLSSRKWSCESQDCAVMVSGNPIAYTNAAVRAVRVAR